MSERKQSRSYNTFFVQNWCSTGLVNITGRNSCCFVVSFWLAIVLVSPASAQLLSSDVCNHARACLSLAAVHDAAEPASFTHYVSVAWSVACSVFAWGVAQVGQISGFDAYKKGSGLLNGALGVCGAYVLLRLFLKYRRWRSYHRAQSAGKKLISALAERLQIRRKQLVYQNIYGTTIYDKWEREKKEFMNREVFNCLKEQGCESYFEQVSEGLLRYLDKVAFEETEATPSEVRKPVNPDVYSPDMDPFDYERYCGRILRQAGWEAIVTSESGDQGADIVATFGKIRLVVQCKLYSRPVGNDAVQQIVAARQHYGAHSGAVVSNASYTTAAQQLARTNRVSLLHHDELLQFVRRLEKMRPTRRRK